MERDQSNYIVMNYWNTMKVLSSAEDVYFWCFFIIPEDPRLNSKVRPVCKKEYGL